MNEADLEKLLTKGRTESRGFFSQVDYRASREAVHARAGIEPAKKARPLWPFALKAVFTAASLLIIAGIFSAFIFGASGGSNVNSAKPLAQQEVLLDSGKGALLSYFPVEAPNEARPGLMSVVWDLSGRNSEMLYSTVFKECNITYPASSISFPDTGRNLVLIFSGCSQDSFIDYRIIGYDNDALIEWLSQDFVPGGKLSVRDGMVIEERGVPHGGPGQYDPAVTYIIPYDIQVSGDIVLPVQELQIKLGEQILLIGVPAHPLTVSSQSGLIEKVEQGSRDSQGLPEYKATGKGSDVLLLEGENITGSFLNINITE